MPAARYQLSAFSGQLLNEHCEHAFDLGGLLRQFFLVVGFDQAQFSSHCTPPGFRFPTSRQTFDSQGRPRADPQHEQTNTTWGTPRVHGEILKLGIELSQATVAEYMVRCPKPPSQTCRTFLGTWSPDGSRIVWASNRSGNFDLYEKDASGTGQDRVLLQSDSFKFPTDWSRDGRYILYRQTDPQTKYDLWVLPLFGERKPLPFLRTEVNETAGVFSPDGRWIAYSSDDSGRYEVYVESFPERGGKRQISTTGGSGARWRQDGKELYYQAPDGKLMAVPVTDSAKLAVGAPVALFEFRPSRSSQTAPHYSVSGDGQRFLLSTIVETEPNAPLTVVTNWLAEVKR